jgi:hypothetical protein
MSRGMPARWGNDLRVWRRGAHRRRVATAAGGLVKGVGGEDANQKLSVSYRRLGSCGATVGSSRWWWLVRGTAEVARPCGGTWRQT